ncbi:hypothetical protein GDO86_002749 [Hymenochirus boettgeri]|uniref:Uncharacterized protein n=1 Tax=Hymenochirus boettgeri TaxID=247094 RepID=A0A8T2K6F2_9PIPI|nr:hypothetical protein GDO86_002749 [Hymenochirus boettgeri]
METATTRPESFTTFLANTSRSIPVTWKAEDAEAAWFIVAIVGFFGFIMFSLLAINIFSLTTDDYPFIKSIEEELEKKKTFGDESFYVNSSALLAKNKGQLTHQDERQKVSENPTKGEEELASVSTTF